MKRDGRSSSNGPAGAPTSVHSTQAASGLSAGRTPDEAPGGYASDMEEVVNRTAAHPTPRRYDQPIDEDGSDPSEQEGQAGGRKGH